VKKISISCHNPADILKHFKNLHLAALAQTSSISGPNQTFTAVCTKVGSAGHFGLSLRAQNPG
jgi:hypothetical protein